MKIVLYLMNLKGLMVLEQILNEGYAKDICGIVCSPDKNVQQDYYDEIRKTSTSAHIPLIDTHESSNVECDFKIAVGWKWIIPDYNNLVVIHDSLLPKYRGFAPVVNALINGEKTIGATMLFASEQYDTGDIIEQIRIDIEYPVKIADVIAKLAQIYANLVCRLVANLHNGAKIQRTPQNSKNASYSLWRDERDYLINWDWPAPKIRRFVDAVGFPFKGALCHSADCDIRVVECEEMDDVEIENRCSGKIIFFKDKCPVVVCGTGLILLSKITNNEGNPIAITRIKQRLN